MTEGATAMAGSSPRFTITHGCVIGALVWVGALAAAFAFAEGTWRAGFVVGVVTGGIGGCIGLIILSFTMSSLPTTALAGRAFGFLVRMMLIMAGLLITMRVYHAEPLAFVFAFFPLFFVFTGLEHFVALGTANTTQALPGARGGN